MKKTKKYSQIILEVAGQHVSMALRNNTRFEVGKHLGAIGFQLRLEQIKSSVNIEVKFAQVFLLFCEGQSRTKNSENTDMV